MKAGYHFTFDELESYIVSIKHECEQKVNANIKLHYDATGLNSSTIFDVAVLQKHPVDWVMPVQIYLGTKHVNNNSDGEYVSDQAVVNTIWDIYHETKHISDHLLEYAKVDVSDEKKNQAKIEIFGHFIPEYRQRTYLDNPAEIGAEQYALQKTISFFKSNNYDVDYERYILDRVNSEKYGFLQWKKYDSLEEVENAFATRYSRSFWTRRFCRLLDTHDELKPVESLTGIKLLANRAVSAEILNCEDAISETNVAMQYIAHERPSEFGSYKCLHKEYIPNGLFVAGVKSAFDRHFNRELPEIDCNGDDVVNHGGPQR